ncbi:fasciclin domain-containing protein [Microvirga vignae]|uniref:fasciclin domain-containing protein n=1 Tax=Microvirga vignae TaxID=1225564 RepID=UPI000A072DAA
MFSLKIFSSPAASHGPSGNGLSIKDKKGSPCIVTISDVMQSNGVIHVIDMVLLPG